MCLFDKVIQLQKHVIVEHVTKHYLYPFYINKYVNFYVCQCYIRWCATSVNKVYLFAQ